MSVSTVCLFAPCDSGAKNLSRVKKSKNESIISTPNPAQKRLAMDDPIESSRRLGILQSCQEQETVALEQLRTALMRPSSPASRQTLLSIVDVLVDALSQHLMAASDGGYMSEITRERPNWHRRIDSLRGANLWCISSLAGLRDDIEYQSPVSQNALETDADLRSWMYSLASIRECEAFVLQRAYSLDIGGEA
jgi:hypothetical protein